MTPASTDQIKPRRVITLHPPRGVSEVASDGSASAHAGLLWPAHLLPPRAGKGRTGHRRPQVDENGGVRLLIMSDTHLPSRARVLPAQVWGEVDAADVVFHAGDWVTPLLLDQLEERSSRLVGVYGNNDGPELRERLPEVARITLDGLRIAMIHETGDKSGRELRADRAFPDTDLLIFGHSHIPWDNTSPGGLRLLNPGSPTDRRRQPVCTYLTAELTEGRLEDVTLQALPLLR